VIRHSRHRM